jgi:integrating conjugative element membrane protein (TIGR03747 family)
MFFETAYYSVQLLGLRLGVLVVSLPLFAVAGLGGFLDGLINWYLRRTGGGRESGFIYQRAKFALWGAVFLLWACYLVLPVALDPRWLIPPFVVLFGLGVRVATAWFKKYL